MSSAAISLRRSYCSMKRLLPTSCRSIGSSCCWKRPYCLSSYSCINEYHQSLRYFSSTPEKKKKRQRPGKVTDNLSSSSNNNNNNHSKEGEEGDEESSKNHKRLDVAIVGYPNAGKSQLLNALIGTKVAAVSRKRHTTRDGILGVATREDTQLVFVDTPGFMTQTAERITRDLSMSASSHMADVDFSLVVIDAAKRGTSSPEYIETLYKLMTYAAHSQGGKFAIVLNKVDLIKPKSQLLDIAQKFGKLADQVVMEKLQYKQQQQQQQQQSTNSAAAKKVSFQDNDEDDLLPEIFYTCAKQGHKDEGVQDVLHHLLDLATPEDWLLPSAHQVTPMDFQARVEEIIREKLYRTLHREVPHQIQQRNRQLELIRGETAESSVMMIQQDLMVYTKSHQNLLQESKNHSSGNLQRIHDTAVPELRQLFQCEVLLTLNVKLIKRNRR